MPKPNLTNLEKILFVLGAEYLLNALPEHIKYYKNINFFSKLMKKL